MKRDYKRAAGWKQSLGAICVLLLLIFSSGRAQLKASGDGHYLTNQDGTPVLLVGTAPWDINNITYQEAKRFADSCYTHNINCWEIRMMSQTAFCGPANVYGVTPWVGSQTFSSTPREAFWAHLDSVIDYAWTKGIYCILYPDYLGGDGGSQGFAVQTQNSSAATMKAWGQFVGNRYAGRPNIIWAIAGDYPPTAYRTKLDSMVAGIREYDKESLITTRDEQATTTNTYWSNRAWLTFRGTYPYWNSYEAQKIYQDGWALYNQLPHRPARLQEAWYENEHSPTTSTQLRQQAYYAVLSGLLAGQTFGNCPTWNFDCTDFGQTPCQGRTWVGELNSPGMIMQRWFSKLFNSRYWWRLVPDANNAIMTAGYGSVGSTNYVTTSYASDGSSIIAYLPTSRSVTVNPSSLSGDSIRVYWFNPGNGAVTNQGDFGKMTRSYSPPGSGDWVLVIDSEDFTPYFDVPGGNPPSPPQAPASPTLVSPPDLSTVQPMDPYLTWNRSATAASYDVQVATNGSFTSTVYQDSLVADTTIQVSGLLGGTTYYWRTRARNAGGVSTWSSAWRFTTTSQLPGQVQLSSPPNQAVLSSDTVHFAWHPSDPGVTGYWMEGSTDSMFATAFVDSSLTDTSTTAYGLISGIQYYWHVRAKNANGWGVFSIVRSFSVLTAGIQGGQQLPSVAGLSQNYPNPFNPRTTIFYDIPFRAMVLLEVFDTAGRRIRTLVHAVHPAGRYSIQWDGRDDNGHSVSSGIYLYQLRTGEGQITKKMLLIK